MKRYLQSCCVGGEAPRSVGADVGLTLPRVAGGVMLAVGHGINKMPPPEGFIGMVEEMGFLFPTLFAWLAGLAELIGGLLLALGLLTRPAAALITVNMAVAAFLYHLSDPWFASQGPSKEMAVLYLVIALQFFVIGGGRFSVDHYLRPARNDLNSA